MTWTSLNKYLTEFKEKNKNLIEGIKSQYFQWVNFFKYHAFWKVW